MNIVYGLATLGACVIVIGFWVLACLMGEYFSEPARYDRKYRREAKKAK